MMVVVDGGRKKTLWTDFFSFYKTFILDQCVDAQKCENFENQSLFWSKISISLVFIILKL